MIKFHCPNCKKQLDIPDDYTGRRIRCNGCNHPSVVPNHVLNTTPDTSGDDLLTAEDLFTPKNNEDSRVCNWATLANSPDDELKLKLPDPPSPPSPEQERIRLASIKRSQEKLEKPTESIEFSDDSIVENPPGYWPFAFPLRGPGLGMIGIFTVGNVLSLASWIFLYTDYHGYGRYRRRGTPYVLTIIVWGYLCWYFKLCIQTAAEGKIRSPDVMCEFEGDYMDLVAQVIKMLLTIAASLTPAIVYMIWSEYSQTAGPVPFLGLAAGGLFLLPMMLMSMILHDSMTGLNPILIVDSMRRTFRQYLVLLFWFFSLLGLTCLIPWLLYTINPWFIIPGLACSVYFLIVIAAFIGRFFYRNEKQLNWEV